MKLKLFVDIFNRKLVTSATSDFPIQLPSIFREDHLSLEVMLLEPTGSLTDPLSTIDISSLSIQVGIGNPDSDPEALQTTFTKNTTTNVFSGELNINTTEMTSAFNSASGNTLSRFLEIEVEGTSGHYHTVIQTPVTLAKDIVTHPLTAPVDVTSGTAFSNSFAATAENSVTTEWTTSSDLNYCHIKGLSGLSNLTGDSGKALTVKSSEDGFELTTISTAGSSINDLSDADTSTSAPTTNESILRWNGTNWVPIAHTLGNVNDVDLSTAATSGQILSYNGTSWIAADGASAGTQNLFATVKGDSGTTTADSTTDTLSIEGGEGIDTSVVGDVVTIAGENATTSNRGIASYADSDFTVTNGVVSLKSISIANGGHGASNASDGFDNLAPSTSNGDLIVHDGTDNTRLAAGSSGQQLAVASGGGLEWVTPSGGGATYTAGDGLDLSGSNEFSLDLKSNGGLGISSTEAQLDINNLSDLTTTTFGASTYGAGDMVAVADASDSNNVKKVKMPAEVMVSVSDETSALTTGLNKLVFRMPHAMTLTEVRASVTTAPTGANLIVDINEGGTSILSTKLSIDDGELTSTSASTAAVISDSALADDSQISIDIDQTGSSVAGAALKVTFKGYR